MKSIKLNNHFKKKLWNWFKL